MEQQVLSCHCGNVQLSFYSWPESVTCCNCSICRRYAALWGYFQPQDVTVEVANEIVAYRWGDGCIDFHHCAMCGCVTHYESADNSSTQRTAINFRMADGLKSSEVKYFDGADSWCFLDESEVRKV